MKLLTFIILVLTVSNSLAVSLKRRESEEVNCGTLTTQEKCQKQSANPRCYWHSTYCSTDGGK